MGLFEQWPYVNFHEMNLDWIIKKIKNVETSEENTAAYAEAAAESAAASQLSADASQQSADAAAEDAASLAGKAAQVDLNTARLNNLIIQGTPTEGNAELLDIRVGYDDQTYDTAGNAVRDQISDLHDLLDDAVMVRGYLPSGTDLFTIEKEGVYSMSSQATFLNAPTGFSGVGRLVVFYSENNTTMFAFIISSYGKKLWLRTGYEWLEIPTPNIMKDYMKYKGSLPADTDVRQIDAGTYAVPLVSTSNITGMPDDWNNSKYGWLIVFRGLSSNSPLLMAFQGNKAWYSLSTTWLPVTTKNSLARHKITVIGDSITAINNTASKNWTKLIEDRGVTVQNLGVGGTGFAHPGTANSRYIDRISSIDSATEIIGVSASFNDMAEQIPVGTVSDTGTSTISGYINDFFDALVTAYPTTPIICYVLNPWQGAHYGSSTKADTYVSNLEEICKVRGIAFKSLYTSSGMYPWIEASRNYYFANADGVHPNNEGHKLLFRKILPFFMQALKTGDDLYL